MHSETPYIVKNPTSKTGKILNGETVNYLLITCLAPIFYFIFTRIFLSFFPNITGKVITGVALAAILFVLYNKFVFIKSSQNLIIKMLCYSLICTFDFFMYFIAEKFIFAGSGFSDVLSGMTVSLTLFFINYSLLSLFVFKGSVPATARCQGRLFRLFMRNRFVVLAAVVSGAILLFVFYCYGAYPFGDNTVLRMDLYHQYGPLFAELYDRVVGMESFGYSWISGGGSTFLGNFFNYLSSPVSAVIFLFQRAELPNAISLMLIIKAMLSAASFTFYLKMSHKSHSFATTAFGLLYTFCGFFLAYYWNIMWLDAMYILPMLVLGIEHIIDNRSFKLYTISLILMMLCNYYMTFIVCIFSIVYFLIYYFSNYSASSNIVRYVTPQKKRIKKLLNNRFVRCGIIFAVASLLAAMVCAIALLPTYFALKGCSATNGTFPATITGNFDIFDFLQGHLAALEPTIRSGEALPNIYSGIIVIILIPLYFMNDSIRLKEKMINVFFLIFMVASFNTNILNYIWHGFHFPNDLPYRFSFIYTFFILTIAFKSIAHIKAVKAKDIMFIGMGAMLFIAICEKMPSKFFKDNITLYISIVFIMIYVLLLILVKKKVLGKVVLSVLMLLCVTTEVIVASTDSYSMGQSLKEYSGDYNDYRSIIDNIEDGESQSNDFYRIEKTSLRTRMDPCWNNYNGISTFSSMAYEKTSKLQKSLGMYGNNINSYTYNSQTPLYNSMFSLKYLINNNKNVTLNEDYFEKMFYNVNTDSTTYKFKYNLPIAFCVNDDIIDWDTKSKNPFEVQSSFAKKASNVKDIFVPIQVENIRQSNVEKITFNGNGSFAFQKINTDTEGKVTLSLEPRQNGNVYIYASSPSAKKAKIINSATSSDYDFSTPYIFDAGYCDGGSAIEVEIDVGSNTTDSIDFYAYSFDINEFEKHYTNISKNLFITEEWNDTSFNGSIYAQNEQILYTSISYDDGWRVYVDGVRYPTIAIGDALLGVKLEAGEHEIEFKYIPQGLILGGATTVLAIGGLSIYFIVEFLNKRHLLSTNRNN